MTKILYVEDNEDNVYMLSRRLKRKGFDIVVAVDGEQGVEMASTEKPDLILMDLHLTDMTGLEVTEKLRQHNNTITIIGLTANATADQKQRCLQSGMNDFLTKPITKDTLQAAINSLFEKD